MPHAYETFDQANAAKREDQFVNGVYLEDGSPRYFLTPDGATDDEVRALAFEIRNGRPMGAIEQQALVCAESHRKRQLEGA